MIKYVAKSLKQTIQGGLQQSAEHWCSPNTQLAIYDFPWQDFPWHFCELWSIPRHSADCC